MNEKNRKLLEDVIKSELESLLPLESGSKEKSSAIDDVVKLCRLSIEETKCDLDYKEKTSRRLMESRQHKSEMSLKEKQFDKESRNDKDEKAFRNRQIAEQVIDRYVKIGLETAGLVLPLIFYAVWMRRGFRFEETGTYTSSTFKNLFNRFKPTKK